MPKLTTTTIDLPAPAMSVKEDIRTWCEQHGVADIATLDVTILANGMRKLVIRAEVRT